MTDIQSAIQQSLIHQILLVDGEVDRVPDRRILDIRKASTGRHRLWVMDDVVYLLKNFFDPPVLEAFNKLKPLAFKADLARYCILYIYGGWYFDLTVSISKMDWVGSLSEETELIFFRDIQIEPGNSVFTTANTLFWVKSPGDSLLKTVIDLVVDRVLKGEYGRHPFYVSGPLALGESIALDQLQHMSHRYAIGESWVKDNQPVYGFNTPRFPNSLEFARRRAFDADVSKEMPSGYQAKSDYYQMWLDRDIYI